MILTPQSEISEELFAHECRIRDLFVQELPIQRPSERLITTEFTYPGASARVDMRTVDATNLLREWEFKIHADYSALGQILTYVALQRRQLNFTRPVRGVIAAFTFQREIMDAIEILNLGIELVRIPAWMAKAGQIPGGASSVPTGIVIPKLAS